MEFQPTALAAEKKLGRFKNLRTVDDAPWLASTSVLKLVGTLIESGMLKVPYGWPAMLNYFHEAHKKGVSKMKLAEALAFCGDRGVFLLSLLDIPPEVKDLLLEVLNVSCGFIKKAHEAVERVALEKRLALVLTRLETLLPLYWQTSTRHILLHIGKHIEYLGAFWAFNMLGVERYHVVIKQLVRYHTYPSRYSIYPCSCISHPGGNVMLI